MHTQTYANTDTHIQTELHRHTCIIICSCIHTHAIPIDPPTHTHANTYPIHFDKSTQIALYRNT